MTLRATLTSKGQFTIPKAIRQRLNLQPGMKVEVTQKGLGFSVRPIKRLTILDLQGSLKDLDDGTPTDVIIEQARAKAMGQKFGHRREQV